MTANDETTASPLQTPPSIDPDWKAKIQAAKEARELGQKLREGKEVSVRRGAGRMEGRLAW